MDLLLTIFLFAASTTCQSQIPNYNLDDLVTSKILADRDHWTIDTVRYFWSNERRTLDSVKVNVNYELLNKRISFTAIEVDSTIKINEILRVHYTKSNIRLIATYENHQITGIAINTPDIYEGYSVLNGKLQGKFTCFKNGPIYQQGFYESGVRDSIWINYSRDLKTETKGMYKYKPSDKIKNKKSTLGDSCLLIPNIEAIAKHYKTSFAQTLMEALLCSKIIYDFDASPR